MKVKAFFCLVGVLMPVYLIADFFPVGAYDVDTLWLSIAHDSLRLNTAMPGYWRYQSYGDRYLTIAEQESLKVILPRAQIGQAYIREFWWYSGLWDRLWESDSNYFSHNSGVKVYDDSAHNHYAWKCRYNQDPAGLMQYGPYG